MIKQAALRCTIRPPRPLPARTEHQHVQERELPPRILLLESYTIFATRFALPTGRSFRDPRLAFGTRQPFTHIGLVVCLFFLYMARVRTTAARIGTGAILMKNRTSAIFRPSVVLNPEILDRCCFAPPRAEFVRLAESRCNGLATDITEGLLVSSLQSSGYPGPTTSTAAGVETKVLFLDDNVSTESSAAAWSTAPGSPSALSKTSTLSTPLKPQDQCRGVNPTKHLD